jgi:hypothetical protein
MNEKKIERLKLTEIPVEPAFFKSRYPSARCWRQTFTGLRVTTYNEPATHGWQMVVWHTKRWPKITEMMRMKEALIPDTVRLGVPLNQETDFMLLASELHELGNK